ncbi:MAG: ester cyclase, partial [Gemmatimonadota bacterium]
MRPKNLASASVVLGLAFGCASPTARLESNKELVRQFTEVLNAADWDALGEIVAEDFVRHSAATEGPPVTSRDEFVRLQQSFLVSFPDQRVTVHQLVAEGDRVAALATYSGTHTGPLGDSPATGKRAEAPFLALFR